MKSECPYTYRDFATHTFEHQEEILRAIARTTATLHEHGIYIKTIRPAIFFSRMKGTTLRLR